jgi:N4-(beta-N-acetylglucosaminyl)-L-asparaginase
MLGPGIIGKGAPAVHVRPAARNVAVASANGLRAVEKAGALLHQGVDTLDAAIEGVKIQELDPEDTSVGYGGLPNEHGVVQLDASCMHGPSRRAGAVGALEGIKTPSVVAKYVLRYTDHIMLVGEGAKQFALSYGFKEEDLLTDRARQRWLRWRANRGPDDDWIDVPRDEQMVVPERHGTINCNTVNANGDISSVTTTSGLAWKIPGRVGDSPLIGAGQRLHGARRGEHQGVRRVPHGRVHAARHVTDRRGPGDAAARRSHHRAAPARRAGPPAVRTQLLRGEQAG